MIAKSYYELAGGYCSLYRSQISYHGEFVFGEGDPSYPETYIAVQYDNPNNPERQLVPHKGKACLKLIRKPGVRQTYWKSTM